MTKRQRSSLSREPWRGRGVVSPPPVAPPASLACANKLIRNNQEATRELYPIKFEICRKPTWVSSLWATAQPPCEADDMPILRYYLTYIIYAKIYAKINE